MSKWSFSRRSVLPGNYQSRPCEPASSLLVASRARRVIAGIRYTTELVSAVGQTVWMRSTAQVRHWDFTLIQSIPRMSQQSPNFDGPQHEPGVAGQANASPLTCCLNGLFDFRLCNLGRISRPQPGRREYAGSSREGAQDSLVTANSHGSFSLVSAGHRSRAEMFRLVRLSVSTRK